MGKRLMWIAAALVLVAIPAVIGLVALRDDGSSSARRAAALVPAGGATEYQLQLTAVSPGVSPTDPKEAIEVESFSWGVETPTTIGAGGAAAGKIKFESLTIKKNVDKASPLLFKQCASGTHYKTAILTLRKAGEKAPYMTYTMETVFITNISHGGSSPDVATEDVRFVFGKLIINSTDRNADGTEAAPVQAGWDQVMNKAAQ